MDMNKLWDEAQESCPWYFVGECGGQVTYNQHVNDPRYADCLIETCPIFHWIEALVTLKTKEK